MGARDKVRGIYLQERAVTRSEEIKGLYVIADNSAVPGRSHRAICEAACEGGAGIIQLRSKTMPGRSFYETAMELRRVTSRYGAILIINDHLDVALAVDAEGVHLGQEDLPVQAARKAAGDRLIIGVSTHSVEQAVEAEKSGADYIGFGAMYETRSKDRPTSPQGVLKLAETVKAVSIPVVAIGGITLEKVPEIRNTHAAAFAVISAVAAAPDIKSEVSKLISAWSA